MQGAVQVGHHLACLVVVDRGEVGPVQPLQEQCASPRVGAQHPHRTTTGPVLQPECFLGAFVVAVEGDLQDRTPAIATDHRNDQ